MSIRNPGFVLVWLAFAVSACSLATSFDVPTVTQSIADAEVDRPDMDPPDTGQPDATPPADLAVVPDAKTIPDAAHDVVWPDDVSGLSSFGERCVGNQTCQSQLCRDDRCSAPCSDELPCPPGPRTECRQAVCRFLAPLPLSGLPKVGFLYAGAPGEFGRDRTHEVGRLYLEDNIDDSETEAVHDVAVSNVQAAITDLISRGFNIIVSTSSNFVTATQNAAANNPDAHFLINAGFVTSRNLGSYFGRMYQPMWLVGRLAAKMTRSKVLGIVGAVVVPETVRHVNAFTLGARSVDPEVKVIVRWVRGWSEPTGEERLARELVEAGADIVYGGTNSPIPIETAMEMQANDGGEVYGIGSNNPDACQVNLAHCVTSVYFNWGPMLTNLVEQMRGGEWVPSDVVWEPMKSNEGSSVVYMMPLNETDVFVPFEIAVDVEGQIPIIARGDLKVFAGPITDTQGDLRNGGEDLTDNQLQNMCWFVDGVFEPDALDEPATVPLGCPGEP